MDKSGLDYLLERRGYMPRRKSGNYTVPTHELSDSDDDDAISR